MAWEIDSEVLTALMGVYARLGSITPPPAGDAVALRTLIEHTYAAYASDDPEPRSAESRPLTITDHQISTIDKSKILVRHYAPDGHGEGLIVYAHGGGMIVGQLAELHDQQLRYLASESGTALLGVDYRPAPEHPHPLPVEDCYSALAWAAANADELGCDVNRLAIAGDSGGGGLAAGAALLARDRKTPTVAKQILMYPMLDDRNVVAPYGAPQLPQWGYEANATAWTAVLSGSAGGVDVSPYAAPARATDLTNLPPAYIMVGALDIFCAENIAYAGRLIAAGVTTELHVYPGATHGFQFTAPQAGVSTRARNDQLRAFAGV